jgi:hypothetical protein
MPGMSGCGETGMNQIVAQRVKQIMPRDKPHIWKKGIVWWCCGSDRLSIGFTPRAAYSMWAELGKPGVGW